MRRPHFLGALLAEQAAVAVRELAAVQLQLYPLGHVGGAGIDGAGRAGVVEYFEGDDLQFALQTRMRKSYVVAGLDVGVGDVGMGHAQRCKNSLANVVVPGGAGHGGDDLSGGHIEKIVVGVVAAETGGGLHEAQLVDDFFARVSRVRPEQQIAFAESHAAAMREQIADGHFVRDIRVVHHEAGEALVDGIVPGELAFIDQCGERGGSECFGVGADAEQGEFVDRRGIAEFAHAVSFGDDDLAVFHDGDGHAGDVEGFHG